MVDTYKYRRLKLGGKNFYFHIGLKSKKKAQAEAQKLRAMGYGARIIPSGGYYYVYSTNSAGYRANK